MKIKEIMTLQETQTYTVLIRNENGVGGFIEDVVKDIEKCLKKDGYKVKVLTSMPVSNIDILVQVKDI